MPRRKLGSSPDETSAIRQPAEVRSMLNFTRRAVESVKSMITSAAALAGPCRVTRVTFCVQPVGILALANGIGLDVADLSVRQSLVFFDRGHQTGREIAVGTRQRVEFRVAIAGVEPLS